jgi:hypothetical protein
MSLPRKFSIPEQVPASASPPEERVLSGYRLREADAGAESVERFYREAIDLEQDLEVWRWRFHGRSGEAPLLPAAYTDDGELVGLYPAIPRRAWVDGPLMTVAQGCHSAVHPDHRAKAPLYLGLVRLLGDLSAARGIPVGFGGGANEDAVRVACTLAGFRLMHRLPILEQRLSWKPAARSRLGARVGNAAGAILDGLGTVRALRDNIEVEVIDRVGDRAAEFDALWAEVCNAYRVCLVRDAAALDWRWSRCPVPATVLLATRDGKPVGYAVVRTLSQDWGRCSTVLDLFRVPPAAGAPDPVATALLEACAQHSQEDGAEFMRFAPCEPGLRTMLEDARGWKPARADADHVLVRTTFDAKQYPEHAELLETLRSSESWYYTQGDSDFCD